MKINVEIESIPQIHQEERGRDHKEEGKSTKKKETTNPDQSKTTNPHLCSLNFRGQTPWLFLRPSSPPSAVVRSPTHLSQPKPKPFLWFVGLFLKWVWFLPWVGVCGFVSRFLRLFLIWFLWVCSWFDLEKGSGL